MMEAIALYMKNIMLGTSHMDMICTQTSLMISLCDRKIKDLIESTPTLFTTA